MPAGSEMRHSNETIELSSAPCQPPCFELRTILHSSRIMRALTTCLVVGATALHGSAAAAAAAAAAAQDDDGPSSSSSCGANDHHDNDDNNKFTDLCINADPDCYRRAALGECKLQSTSQYMTTRCTRACGQCSQAQRPDEATIQKEEEEELRNSEDNSSPELELDCRDLHEMCPIWSGQGECVLNPKYMATACRESCLLCVNARASRERGEDTERIRRKRTYVTSVDAGPQQRMDGSTTEQQENTIRNLLQHMDRYAKVTLTDVEVSRETRMLCRNDHDECAILAVQGQCRNGTLYMLNHCSLVCQFCDKVEKFRRCTNDKSHAEASGLFDKAGDLNSFFRQAKESGRWDGYGTEYLLQPGGRTNADSEAADADNDCPWVIRFDSFLSASESKRIIEIANDIGWSDSQFEEEGMFGENPGNVPARRSSKTAVCPAGAGCDSDQVYTAVMNRVADTIGISRHHFEHTEIVKYEHRDSFGVHHDYRIHDLWKPAGPRVITMILYLSDVEEGGSTGFPDLDWLFIKPKRGQALLFPNVLDSDPTKADQRMVHEGLPVVSGTKHIAAIYIHMRGWAEASEKDCV